MKLFFAAFWGGFNPVKHHYNRFPRSKKANLSANQGFFE
jgi:hypothetical protein